MKTISWFGLILVVSPLLAFGCLVFLHPVGDPQESPNLFIRFLDFQGTYWMRHAIPVPPPLLVAGLLVSVFLVRRFHSKTAWVGTVVGFVLLGLWSLIMVVPLLVHVN
jgi:hypothetical protein